ncbi:serine hydrolase domain-containing protein [Saccharomonospora xinjiangensis]|uniref:serine hydrolase domain-containing protein n=1 Tax=Saccharomonospora xinjiangensis TaxID=75294 RepID=UPI00106F37A7|nr:serine hydrolase domain-containing protein [Saccharomonospora xinjiangensis]QBQ60648.1 D-alanyl-D-alanine carboxypeptidase precursor [Saccharomonospora xinjiangensis]
MAGTTRRRWLAGVVSGVALAVVLPVAPVVAQTGEHAETQAVLDQFQQKAGPGAAIHAGDGTSAWTLSSGSASIRENRAITASDHFRIGSQTKTFTAAVVLQLFDEGRVDLDAPIERYLPGVITGNYDGSVITVRQLLNHTSGLVRDTSGAKANADGTYDLAALVSAAMDEQPQAQPGEVMKYSNVGYLVLGLLIEELTGRPVGDAIAERITEPLGLGDTSFPEPGDRALPEPFVPGYQGTRIGGFFFWFDATTLSELSWWSSAGAMSSTMEDLAAFYRALLDGKVMSEEALAEMRTVVPFPPAASRGYGLGVFEQPLSCGGVAWGHEGLLPTGHLSRTMVTDDGRFASMMTNANLIPQDPGTAEVIDAALCEGRS